MAGTLTVQNLQGPSSGAFPDRVVIPAGQTLDVSGGSILPSADQIIQTKTVTNSNRQTGTVNAYINSINLTPKYNNSYILCSGVWHHGIGPAATNLDGWGHQFYFAKDGTVFGTVHKQDVFPGAFTVSYSYGPEWYINSVSLVEKSIGHTAGTTYNFQQWIGIDSPNSSYYWMINRPHAYNGDDRGTCSFTVSEIAQ